MKFYYVYILRCSDNSLYVGITNDVERRLNKHNEGKLKNAYTFIKITCKIRMVSRIYRTESSYSMEKEIKRLVKTKKRSINKR